MYSLAQYLVHGNYSKMLAIVICVLMEIKAKCRTRRKK